ncbi:MAG: AbrB/MazE/SpoVT family DNA-binding domain-containing protein [Fimbriimonadaceae bacterium]|nr:AbrB/MazE/SpoVT family DNA-binding domain-containing protein [Fimbriimonadaceae bacterium]
MKQSVEKWGNSLAVRLPSAFVKELGLRQGSSVDLSLVEGGLLLKQEKLTLEAMLEGMTEQNLHGEIDFGGPVGDEAL